ncbi:MAG: VanW family protein [Patescibacteria group bacterium]
MNIDQVITLKPKPSKIKTTLLLIFSILIVVLLLCFAVISIWAQQFKGRIAPNVWVGSVQIGGLDPESANTTIQKHIDNILQNGIEVTDNSIIQKLELSTVIGTDVIDNVRFSIKDTLEDAKQIHHDNNFFIDNVKILNASVRKTKLKLPTELVEDNLLANLGKLFPGTETPPQNAGYKFFQNDSQEWDVSITDEKEGIAFDKTEFLNTLLTQLENLNDSSIVISTQTAQPTIQKSFARYSKQQALIAVKNAPYTIEWKENNIFYGSWTISQDQIINMLIPASEQGSISIDDSEFENFINPIIEKIEKPATDATFEIKNGKAVNFTLSKPGIKIDVQTTLDNIISAINNSEPTNAIELVVEWIEPNVPVSEVNNIGIVEALGTGVSNFKGSPQNRIKNIKNGAKLLNGLIIAPGEEFSLLNALKPFTKENGYLNELVIKGDKIEPELGGGLCQIGTTTFRTAMNSGLPIVDRRNHSLVVSYYNDPSNGNPGTDATIYDPAPDFKFLNDTGNHILFQAEVIEDISQLQFTFWGTADGRKGSYTPPIVLEWFGVGEPIYIETIDLEPGEEKCQGAHVGADASFTYNLVRPNGTIEKQLFESHYRPLPKICLIGVEEIKSDDKIYSDTVE